MTPGVLNYDDKTVTCGPQGWTCDDAATTDYFNARYKVKPYTVGPFFPEAFATAVRDLGDSAKVITKPRMDGVPPDTIY